jgi:hypothetical protein
MTDTTVSNDSALFDKGYDKAAEALDSLVENRKEPLPLHSAAGFLVAVSNLYYVSYGREATEHLFEFVNESLDRAEEATAEAEGASE